MNEPARVSCLRLSDGAPPEAALQHLLESMGGLGPRVVPGARVLIKPNFVAPVAAATTDLAFVEFFVKAVRALGAIPIMGESSGFEFDTHATFEVLGVNRLAARLNVPLLNFEAAGYDPVPMGNRIGSLEVAQSALSADLILNLPVLKGHTVTGMTGAVKNLFGLLSKPSRRRAHAVGLHGAIRALALHMAPKTLHFVDARRSLRRAVFAEAEPLGYLLAGADAFALDHVGAGLLGVNPTLVRHLGAAPNYALEGDVPPRRHAPAHVALRDRLRRAAYAAAYGVDHLQSRVSGCSILPRLHWHLGVHPELAPGLSEQQIAAVAASCPVGAIDDSGVLHRNLCQPVRCLACRRDHPTLVRLRGLSPPTFGSNHARSS